MTPAVGFGRARPFPLHRVLVMPTRRRRLGNFVLARATSVDSEFDAFLAAPPRGRAQGGSGAAYLRWRYDQHPTRTYETLVFPGGMESYADTACSAWA